MTKLLKAQRESGDPLYHYITPELHASHHIFKLEEKGLRDTVSRHSDLVKTLPNRP